MATKMPPEVPVLTARKICRGQYNGANGTHCLSGWRTATFFEGRQGEAVVAVMVRLLPFRYCGIADFNDDARNPKSVVAELWNKAMQELGYRKRGNKFVLTPPPAPRRQAAGHL